MGSHGPLWGVVVGVEELLQTPDEKNEEEACHAQGYLAHEKTPTAFYPTVGPCLGPYGGLNGVGVSL